MKLFTDIIIAHSVKRSCHIFDIQGAVYGVCCSTATCNGGSVGGLFVTVVTRAGNWHFVLLILVMTSCHSCHRMTRTVTEHPVSREGGVEEAERPGNLSWRLQNLRAVHLLLSWLMSKVVCQSGGNISLAPCWGSLINRGSPTVRKVLELFIIFRRYYYRPALFSVGDHEPIQDFS